ncbi:MAG: MFS transporter [Candidatus Hodarchaeota archaeon]
MPSKKESIIDRTISNLTSTEFLREKLTISQKYRNILSLGLFGFISALIVSIIITYYNTWYLRDTLGLSETTANTVFSYSTAAGSIGVLLAVIIGGAYSDDYRSEKYGARAPFILAGCLIGGIMMVLVPLFGELTPSIHDNIISILPLIGPMISLELFMIITFSFCFFIKDAGIGLAASPNGALLSELFTQKQRGWVGLIGAGLTTLGSFTGLIVFRFIADVSVSAIFIVAGIVIIAIGILIFFMVQKVNPPFPPIDDTITDIISTPKYLFNFGSGGFTRMLVVQSLWGFSVAAVSIYLVQHLIDNIGILKEDIGIVLLITGLVAAVMAIPAGLFIQKVGKVKTAIVGSIVYGIYCVGMALIGAGDSLLIVLSLAAVGGFGAIFIESVRVSLPADLVPEGKEAQFMGINKLAQTWTEPFVAILGAQIIIIFAGQNPIMIIYLLAACSAFLSSGVLFFINYEKMIREEYEEFYQRFLRAKDVVERGLDYLASSIIGSN